MGKGSLGLKSERSARSPVPPGVVGVRTLELGTLEAI
jgi:hypothetical protein